MKKGLLAINYGNCFAQINQVPHGWQWHGLDHRHASCWKSSRKNERMEAGAKSWRKYHKWSSILTAMANKYAHYAENSDFGNKTW